jgi:flagellar motility protein MotE (MotC chaperone)
MTSFLPRFRFLGVTIFASALLLSVKIGDIWSGLEGILNGGIAISAAEAQQTQGQPPAAPAGNAPTPLGNRPASPPGLAQAPRSPGQQQQPAARPGAAQAQQGTPAGAAPGAPASGQASAVSRFITDDPTLLTQNEIDLLQKLAERRERLDGREREMDRRIGLLQAAEQRIERKVSDLKKLQGTIEGLLKKHSAEQDNNLASLVKIYEAMKPKDAARIFQALEMDTLLLVAERMKERKLAPIMASLTPEKAKEITVELTQLRKLPRAGS